MKSKILIIILAGLTAVSVNAQSTQEQIPGNPQNTSQRLIEDERDRNLVIGGYGQVDYNQPFGDGKMHNGKLDVHRMVLMVGYHFTDRLQMITEIEFEHVKEVYVEQAFINYRLNDFMNLQGCFRAQFPWQRCRFAHRLHDNAHRRVRIKWEFAG